MTKKCIGCGVTLQTINKEEKGYIREDKYKDSSYCERCFRLINYNEYKDITLNNINETIINRVNKDKHFVFFLVDFLNINSETMSTYKKINTKKVLIISKKDLIPYSIKETKITNFIKDTYDIKEDIIYLSSKNKTNINKIITITKENNNKSYILGYTNSGKSTLINSLTSIYNNKKDITTSSIPNTTLDFLSIKIDDITLIDSPGFNMINTFYDYKDYNLIRHISPKSYIKAITYQMKPNTGILIEDKIYIQTTSLNSMTLYLSNNLNIKKVFNNDYLNDKEEINIKIDNNQDIIIKGLGFINIKKGCNLIIRSDYNNLIEIRKSLFRKEE